MDVQMILAMGSSPEGGAGGGMLPTIIMFGAIFLIFYFMIIRPQQKRMKEHKKLVEGVKRGDSVRMNGGIRGTVFEVKDDSVMVEIAKNTVVTFDKGAIQSVVQAESEKM